MNFGCSMSSTVPKPSERGFPGPLKELDLCLLYLEHLQWTHVRFCLLNIKVDRLAGHSEVEKCCKAINAVYPYDVLSFQGHMRQRVSGQEEYLKAQRRLSTG